MVDGWLFVAMVFRATVELPQVGWSLGLASPTPGMRVSVFWILLIMDLLPVRGWLPACVRGLSGRRRLVMRRAKAVIPGMHAHITLIRISIKDQIEMSVKSSARQIGQSAPLRVMRRGGDCASYM
ncbi:hypothetical protein CTA1_1074 [Colletotrichum tanaceti]|uniref:Uncharacterized protein n=1 Tax=Colletotrichum tanaceti TaxID=1306861 RepID=A0A4V6DG80_9PEZI|nr:hypothetical protein CTA1_1074 [Colletotrichum tanaceti]